eukprot:jgi/Mesvir1/2256/Mv19303-RA.1
MASYVSSSAIVLPTRALVSGRPANSAIRHSPLVSKTRLLSSRPLSSPSSPSNLRLRRYFDLAVRASGAPPKEAEINNNYEVFDDNTVTLPPPDVSPNSTPPAEWVAKYLYDGKCSVCLGLVDMLRSRSGSERIWFEDFTVPAYDPKANKDISVKEAMDTIHVITPEGSVLKGLDGLSVLYGAVGLGWLFTLAKFPMFSPLAQLAYKLVSKNRQALGSGMDAAMMALGKIEAEKKGEKNCTEDGECRAKDEPAVPEPEPVKGEEEKVDGSADKDQILAIYVYGQGKGLRAAPINAKTGRFLAQGITVPLAEPSIPAIVEGAKGVIAKFGWKGAIGMGMPGLVKDATERDADGQKREMVSVGKRRDRFKLEEELTDAFGLDVVVMSGAEANGYGEMKFGVGREQNKLKMMVTLGQGLGVALFDHGVLVRNIDVSDITWTWNLSMWSNAQLPDDPLDTDETKWDRWAERVRGYLKRLDERLDPDLIVIGGAAAKSYKRLIPRIRSGISKEIVPAMLGPLAGVKGVAAGAKEQLRLREVERTILKSVGNEMGRSPQALTRTQLREVFDTFDKNKSGYLTLDELEAAISGLGVNISKIVLRNMLIEADEFGEGQLSFSAFSGWWEDIVRSSPVAMIHKEADFDRIIEEESAGGRLVVLEVGFTYCRPCKAFEPQYHHYAEMFHDARFLRCNGNENREMVHLGRDRLKVKSTPSFYFFRHGRQVHFHSGANVEKFEAALREHVRENEAGYAYLHTPKPKAEDVPTEPQPEAPPSQPQATPEPQPQVCVPSCSLSAAGLSSGARVVKARQLNGKSTSVKQLASSSNFASHRLQVAKSRPAAHVSRESLTCKAVADVVTIKTQLKGAKKDIAALILEASANPILVRLGWHDSGTFDKDIKEFPQRGGANGSLRFDAELKHGANAGLVNAVKMIEPIKQKYPDVSYADLFQLASAVAIELAGGPKIDMKYGRVDVSSEKECAVEGKLPAGDPKNPAQHLKEVFYRMGFNDQEIVALSGAHTLGRVRPDRSGFGKASTKYTKDGPGAPGGTSWTPEWLKFDNSYFVVIKSGNDEGGELIRLVTDEAVFKDPGFRPHAERYAASQDAFFKEYAAAHKKLSELGAKFEPAEGIKLD